jgi:hypothetical protein
MAPEEEKDLTKSMPLRLFVTGDVFFENFSEMNFKDWETNYRDKLY